MPSIDKRIVQMNFNNSQFEKGVSQTMKTLSNFKKELNFDKQKDSFRGIEKSANNIRLNGISNAVDAISKRFSTFGIVGMTAIQKITNSAMAAGRKMEQALVNPIIEGGKNRALNIEQAKFQFQGLGLSVKKSMDSALEAVSGTAYGLDEAAKIASQMAASGMKAGNEMTKSLRGVAGVAAMTGSDFMSIGNIFAQVSGKGRLMGDELLQLSSRGINAAATLAEQMGTTEEAVRAMVTDGLIDFKTFYTAMDNAFGEHAKDANKTFTGSLSNMRAALARIGADVATPALKDFRNLFNTLTPLIDKIHSALGPLTDSISSSLHNAIQRIRKAVKGIDDKDIVRIGATFDKIFRGIGNTISFIGKTINLVKKGFENIVPPATAIQIRDLASAFVTFTKHLTLSKSAATIFVEIGMSIGNMVQSIINIIKAGKSIIVPAMEGFREAFANAFPGTELGDALVTITDQIRKFTETLGVTTSVADNIKETVKSLTETFLNGIKYVLGYSTAIGSTLGSSMEDIRGILKSVRSIVSTSIKTFTTFAKTIKDQFGGALGKGRIEINLFGSIVSTVFLVINKVLDTFANAFAKSGNVIGSVTTTIIKIINSIGPAVSSIGNVIKNIFNTIIEFTKPIRDEIKAIFDELGGAKHVFDSSMLLAFVKSLTKLTTKANPLSDFFAGFEGLGKSLKGVLNSTTKALNSFATGVKVQMLKSIAVVVAILAASVFTLSKVDPKNVAGSLGALGAELVGVMAAMGALSKFNFNTKKINESALAMAVIADALRKLSETLMVLKDFKIDKDYSALIALAAVMASMVTMLLVLGKVAKKMDGINFGKIAALAGVIATLTSSLKGIMNIVLDLKDLNVDQMKAGFGGLGAVIASTAAMLVILGKLASNKDLKPKKMVSISLALIVLGTSIKSLSKSIILLSAIKDPKSLAIGMAAFEGVLASVGIMLKALSKISSNKDLKPSKMALMGVAMVILAASIKSLTNSVVVLSRIKANNLAPAMAAFAGILGGVLVTIEIMAKIIGRNSFNSGKMVIISAALITLAKSISTLTKSVAMLASIKSDNLAPAMAAFAGILGGVLIAIGTMAKIISNNDFESTKMAGIAISMVLLAGSIKSLSKSVVMLSGVDAKSLSNGFMILSGILAEVIVAIGVLSHFAENADASKMLVISGAIVVLSVAVTSLTDAVMKMASLSLEQLGIGLLGMTAGLAAMVTAIKLMPKGNEAVSGAGQMIVMTLALNVLTNAIIQLSTINIKNMGTALLGIAGGLGILVAAMVILNKTMPSGGLNVGSLASLLMMAVVVKQLAPAIQMLGQLKLEQIMIAVGGLAAALIALGLVAKVLEPVTPALIKLGGAFALISLSIVGIGAGIALITTAFAMFSETMGDSIAKLADEAPAMFQSLTIIAKNALMMIDNIIQQLIPIVVNSIALLITEVANKAPQMAQAGVTIFTSMLDAATQLVPNLIELGYTAIKGFIEKAIELVPEVVNLGVTFITSLLEGIASNIASIVDSAVKIAKEFIKGITKVIPDIVKLGITLLKEFIKGVTKVVPDLVDLAETIINELLDALEELIPNVVDTGMKILTGVLDGIGENIDDVIEKGGKIVENFLTGIGDELPKIVDKGAKMVIKLLNGFSDAIDKNADKFDKAVDKFMTTLLNTIGKEIGRIPGKMKKYGGAIIDGLGEGLKESFGVNPIDIIKDIANDIINRFKDLLGINSPSKVFKDFGAWIIQGLINGIKSLAEKPAELLKSIANKLPKPVRDALGIHSPSKVFFEIGKYIIDGLANGIISMESKVPKLLKDIAKKSVSAFTSEIQSSVFVGAELINIYAGRLNEFSIKGKEFNTALYNMGVALDEFTLKLYKNSDAYKTNQDKQKEITTQSKKLAKEREKLEAQLAKIEKGSKKSTKNQNKTSTKKNTKSDSIKKDTKNTKENTKAKKDNSKAMEKNTKETTKNVSATNSMVSGVNGVIKSNKKGLNLTREVTRANDDNTASIERNISAENKKGKSVTTTVKNIGDAVKKSMDNKSGGVTDFAKKMGFDEKTLKKYEAKGKGQKENTKTTKKNTKATKDNTKATKANTKAQNDAKKTETDRKKSLKDVKKALKENEKAQKQLAKEQEKLNKQIEKDRKAALEAYKEEIKSTMTEMLDFQKFSSRIEFNWGEKLTKDDDYKVTPMSEFLSNNRDQFLAINEWLEDIKKITAMGYDEIFVKQVREAGYTNRSLLDTLLSGRISQVEEANKQAKKLREADLQDIRDQYKENLQIIADFNENIKKMVELGFSKDVIEDFVKQGPEAAGSLAKAFSEATPETVKEINKLKSETKKTLQTFTDELTTSVISSGMTGGQKIGTETVNGIVKNTKSNKSKKKGKAAIKNLINTITDGTIASQAKKKGKEIGEAIVNGVVMKSDKITDSNKNKDNKMKMDDPNAGLKQALEEQNKIRDKLLKGGRFSDDDPYFDKNAIADAATSGLSEVALEIKNKLSEDLKNFAKNSTLSIGWGVDIWANVEKVEVPNYVSNLIADAVGNSTNEEVKVEVDLLAETSKVNRTYSFDKDFQNIINNQSMANEFNDLLEQIKSMGFSEEWVDYYRSLGINGIESLRNAVTANSSQVAAANEAMYEQVTAATIKAQEESDSEIRKGFEKSMKNVGLNNENEKLFEQGLKDLEAKGYSKEYIEYFKSQGASSLNELKGFLTASGDEVLYMNEQYAIKLENEMAKTEQQAEENRKESLQTYLDNAKANNEKIKEYKKTLQDLKDMGYNEDMLKYFQSLGVANLDTLKTFLEASGEQVIEANEIVNENVALSSEKLVEDAQARTDKMRKWQEDIHRLVSMGFNQEIINDIISKGVDGSTDLIASYLTMTPDQVKSINDDNAEALKISDEIAKLVAEDYDAAGKNAVGEFADSISDIKKEGNEDNKKVIDSFSLLNGTVETEVRTGFNEAAVSACKNFSRGIESWTPKTTGSAKKMASKAYNAVESNFNYSDGRWLGSSTVQGLIDGINVMKQAAIDAAKELADAVHDAAKTELDINSPSKKFLAIGNFCDIGLANGILGGVDKVVDSGKTLAQTALEATRDAFNKAGEKISTVLDIDPTIRPVIDLDKAMSDVQKLNTELSRNSAISLNAEIERSRNNRNNGNNGSDKAENITNNYTFNQTNNSPKELSRIDIYRQTKSQFAQFRNEVVARA